MLLCFLVTRLGEQWLTVSKISHAQLKEIMHYDPETGLATSLVNRRTCKIGNILGTLDNRGYIKIKIFNIDYRMARLIWFYMTSKWPEGQVDHKDTDKTNNKWLNLREATSSENCTNRNVRCTSRTGVKGVGINAYGKYYTGIKIKGVYRYIGTYETLNEATEAYANAAKENHGEFANYTKHSE